MGDSTNERDVAADERSAAVSVGQTLSKARLSQGLLLEDLAAELRIEAKQLLALEQDRFDQIGVPVFVKGYLRQYGQRLGLSYNDLLALYYRQVDTQEVDIRPSRTIKLRDERQVTVWVLAMLALAVLVVFLAVWWLNDPALQSALRPSRANDAPPAAPSAAPVPAPEPGSGSGRVFETQPSTSGTLPSSGGSAANATELAARTPDTPAVSTAAEAPAHDSSVAVDSAATATAPSEGAPSAGVELDVSFDEDSWAEIVDARGERLFYGLGRAGRSVELHGEPPFSTVLGNASGVRVVVDGRPYAVPGQSRPSNRVQFAITVPEE